MHLNVRRLNFPITRHPAVAILAFAVVIPLPETTGGVGGDAGRIGFGQAKNAHINFELENQMIDFGELNEALQGATSDDASILRDNCINCCMSAVAFVPR